MYRELIYRMIHRIDKQQHDNDNTWLVDIDLITKWCLSQTLEQVKELLIARTLHDTNPSYSDYQKFKPNFEKHHSNRETKHMI